MHDSTADETMTAVRSGPFRRGWVVGAAAGVLLWRVAAFLWPSSLVITASQFPLPFALLGVLFVVCGLWPWWIRPNRWTAIFLVYGLGSGVHWGGTIGLPPAGLEVTLFFLYLGATAIADAALLHLALIFPSGRLLGRGMRVALYSAAGLALLLAPIAGLLSEAIVVPLAGLVLLIANMLSLLGGLVFVARLFTSDRTVRRAARLPLIVSGMVIAGFVALLGAGGVLPGQAEVWNLVFGLVPVCLATALVSLGPSVLIADPHADADARLDGQMAANTPGSR